MANQHKTLLDAVRKHADRHPEKTAIVGFNGKSQSYGELWGSIQHFKNLLKDAGLSYQDRVLLIAGKECYFPAQYLAVHLAGGISVPIDPTMPEQRIHAISANCNPKYVLGESGIDRVEKFGEQYHVPGCSENAVPAANLGNDTLADLIYTSGTTGRPKGVLLTHKNLVAAIRNINCFLGTKASDVEIIALPLSHSFGLGRLRCVLWEGGCVVMVDGFGRPKNIFSCIEKYGATGIGMVPAAWATLYFLSREYIGRYASQIRYVEIGSAPMLTHHKELLAGLLPDTRVCMHYGLTEASRAIFQEFHEDRGSLTALGRASPLARVAIKDDRGANVPNGQHGEICVKGGMVTKRYWGDSVLTQKSFWGDWFRTGDIGHEDAAGLIYLFGRKTEIINVGGRKVSPVEIEEALRRLPEIMDAAVVGISDPVSGEAVKAYLVTGDNKPELRVIQQFLKKYLESYKIPLDVSYVSSIPKTASGKIQRHKLLRCDRDAGYEN